VQSLANYSSPANAIQMGQKREDEEKAFENTRLEIEKVSFRRLPNKSLNFAW